MGEENKYMRKLIFKRLMAVLLTVCLTAALGISVLADDAPVIYTDVPTTLTVAEGQTLTLTIEASGSDLSYQWYRVHADGDTPVEGQTSNTYQILSVDTSYNDAEFYCFVQNSAGSDQSETCKVTVLTKPVITEDVSPTNLTISEGDTIMIIASATGASATQWYYKKGDGTPVPLDGQTDSMLAVKAVSEFDGADFYCQFVNSVGAVTTSYCRVNIQTIPQARSSRRTRPVKHSPRADRLSSLPARRTPNLTHGTSSAQTARAIMTTRPSAMRTRASVSAAATPKRSRSAMFPMNSTAGAPRAFSRTAPARRDPPKPLSP